MIRCLNSTAGRRISKSSTSPRSRPVSARMAFSPKSGRPIIRTGPADFDPQEPLPSLQRESALVHRPASVPLSEHFARHVFTFTPVPGLWQARGIKSFGRRGGPTDRKSEHFHRELFTAVLDPCNEASKHTNIGSPNCPRLFPGVLSL